MEQTILKGFKGKRESWIECLSGTDRNSIFKQIFEMIWNVAVFKVINEARKISPLDKEGKSETNGMLHNFIDDCFFDSQFLAIRRITDAAYSLEDNGRGIFSLVALLKDLRKNISLMTRENLFAAEGLEYDYEAISKRELEYGIEQSRSNKAFWVPSELDSWRVKSRHEEIDALCGVSAEQRKPSDIIRVKILDYLISMLEDASVDIKVYATKYIAHLATPKSRERYKVDTVSITLGHLWNAHKVICQVANFIDLYILTGSSHSFLPVPQFDNFEFIDKPLISYSNIEILNKSWHDYQKETDSWGSWGMKEFLQQSGL